MRYLNELRDGESVIEFYFCKQRQSMTSKTGKNYLSLVLQDKTGTASAKIWEQNNNIQSFETGDFIKIAANVQTYNGEIQLIINKLRRAHEGEYDEADYIPSTKFNIDEMYKEFLDFIPTFENKHIKKLVNAILVENEYINKEFKKHTAAKAMHHNYLGGLLEHTLSVTKMCQKMAEHYPMANRDILVACAMLHDVAKIYELSDFPNIEYTDSGELLGHLVMGSDMIGREAEKIEGFPVELKHMMQHCILSHHGQLEYGSPKTPRTLEAMLLHYADDMDAYVKMFEDSVNACNTQSAWVGYNRIMERNLRKTKF
ncbi:MAG: HD domain-containing protein [Firmicutes bacterium]|nr:HD domain-containing protein [Bacillota bacterium]